MKQRWYGFKNTINWNCMMMLLELLSLNSDLWNQTMLLFIDWDVKQQNKVKLKNENINFILSSP